MQIGTLALFQRFGYDETVTDSQVYQEELRLAEQIEDLGYDSHWCVEHHFEDYSFCPDNTVYLRYLAAKTRRIKLATGRRDPAVEFTGAGRGLDAFAEAYMNAQAWGTPRQILGKLEHWRSVVGRFDIILAFRAAGIAYADAAGSMRLFAQKVMPELRRWDAKAAA
jgi:Luciferase-like monooxygenase